MVTVGSDAMLGRMSLKLEGVSKLRSRVGEIYSG